MKYYARMESPIGLLELAAENNALTEIRFVGDEEKEFSADPSVNWKEEKQDAVRWEKAFNETEQDHVMQEALRQLREYFAGERKEFSVPLSLKGTDFQKKVWNALLKIPYGETRTYGEIAASVENPKASRAVGMANHHNPIPIIIPCHRVIGKNGRLVGYSGGLDKKTALLELERSR